MRAPVHYKTHTHTHTRSGVIDTNGDQLGHIDRIYTAVASTGFHQSTFCADQQQIIIHLIHSNCAFVLTADRAKISRITGYFIVATKFRKISTKLLYLS